MSLNDSIISKGAIAIWEKIVQDRSKLRSDYVAYWSKYNLFSLSWWLMVVLLISLWVIWWKRVDRTKLHEIITFGLMVTIIALFVDIVGCEHILWGYPIDLVPLIPPLIITDFGIFPVTYMLVYQYFSSWKSFAVATVIMSAFLAFVAEPLAEMLGIYQVNNWSHLHDIPLYILLGLSQKWILGRILVVQENSRR